MFKLTCQRTFIHAEDEEDRSATCQRRSQSEPPVERTAEQTYASALKSRADQLHYWLRKKRQGGGFKQTDDNEKEAGAEASTEAETQESTNSLRVSSKSSVISELEFKMSQGSLGHPEAASMHFVQI